MRNAAIFGYKDGAYLGKQIGENPSAGFDVVYYVDNNKDIQGRKVDGIPVLSFEQLCSQVKKGEVDFVIVTVRKGFSRYKIVSQLEAAGITEIVLFRPSPLTYHLPIIFDRNDPNYSRQWLWLKNNKKPIVYHLETHAADGCNLNCKGCLHFSNLHGKEEFPDFDEVLTTVSIMNRNCEIFQFRVLGGEPLLNPELGEFLRELRIILPYSDLAVISNGILIPKMSESLLKLMSENQIGFNLTLYPPTIKMKEDIYRTLDNAGVSYGSHEAKTDRFERFMLLNPTDSTDKAYEYCVPRGILTIKGKNLYRCPLEAYIDRFYSRYKIPITPPEGINLWEFNGDWRKLVSDLYNYPNNLCKYCTRNAEYYEWSNGKPEQSDWIVRNANVR